MTSLVIWCSAFATYLVFAGTVSADESIVGAVLATLAVFWAHAIRNNARRRFCAAREQIVPVLRAIAGLYPSTLRTCAVWFKTLVWGGSPGRTMLCRFHFGPDDEPRQCSRRALAVLCASLAPDRFVVNVERRRSEAVFHAVDRSGRPPHPEWLQ